MGWLKCLSAAAVALALAAPAAAQFPAAGDKDDQAVITGCVMGTGDDHSAGPRSLLVWSKGDVYLDSVSVQLRPSETGGAPVGTAGTQAVIFYWLDDEDDFAKYVGHRVEVVGELSDELDEGEFEVDHQAEFTEIEFEVDGRQAKARVPAAWLGPGTPATDNEFDIVVRRVDVEKVTVVGVCSAR